MMGSTVGITSFTGSSITFSTATTRLSTGIAAGSFTSATGLGAGFGATGFPFLSNSILPTTFKPIGFSSTLGTSATGASTFGTSTTGISATGSTTTGISTTGVGTGSGFFSSTTGSGIFSMIGSATGISATTSKGFITS